MLWVLLVIGQTVTYQDRLIGQRALGMGGAFTAIGDDPTASYHNPAGLMNLQRLQLEVGLPIIGFDFQRIRGGLIPQAPDKRDRDSFAVLAYPTSVGAAAGLGVKDSAGRELIVVSATLVVPWQRNLALRQSLQSESTNAFHLWQESEQTLLIGPAIAVRLGPISFGVTAYYVHQNLVWINSRSSSTPAGDATSLSSVVEGWVGQINPRVGVMARLSPHWTIGLTSSLSSHRLFGDATVRMAAVVVQPTMPLAETLYTKEGIRLDRPLPWEVRFGVGYEPFSRMTLALDITAYMPQRFNYFANVDEALSGAPASVKREFIMNANIGAEYKMGDSLVIRFGGFTNLTAAQRPSPDCLTKACVPYVQSGGLTGSLGFTVWRVALDFGINATGGFGSVQQFLGPSNYVWSPYERYSWQLFVGGNLGKVINSTAEQIKHVIEKGQNK